MPRRKVAITGLGIVSALGLTVEETTAALEAERSGLGPLTLFPSQRRQHILVGQAPSGLACERGVSRSMALACHAATAAGQDAGLADSLPERAAIVLGACTGGMLESEAFLREMLAGGSPDLARLRYHTCGSATDGVAARLGLGGLRMTISDACASGASALAAAGDLIACGDADVVFAGGVDTLTALTLNGFCSLLVVAEEGCRPFDAERQGLSLGEGGAVLVLEEEQHALSRQARIHGYLAGWGFSCDAFHATAPDPQGQGMQRAMAGALDAAGLRPSDLDYINAHGSGTVDNDRAEAAAIRRLFADRVPAVSSTKRFFGHTLAAAGAIESVVCILCLERQRVPANLGLREADADLGFEPVATTRATACRAVMSNSFGFGGVNCSLVFTQAAEGAGR